MRSMRILKAAVMFVILFLIILTTGCKERPDNTKVIIVSVDAFARNPEQFKGYVGVEGPVTGIDEKSHFFGLGCEDACIVIPIKFMGKLPQINSNVIAYGSLKNQDGRYFFDAVQIENGDTKW